EVLNRAADIFRMAGHMLGERLLFFFFTVASSSMSSMMADRHFRGGGTSLASTFASIRSNREALGFMGAGPSRAQRLSCRQQPRAIGLRTSPGREGAREATPLRRAPLPPPLAEACQASEVLILVCRAALRPSTGGLPFGAP